jgi:hypothetical protein
MEDPSDIAETTMAAMIPESMWNLRHPIIHGIDISAIAMEIPVVDTYDAFILRG